MTRSINETKVLSQTVTNIQLRDLVKDQESGRHLKVKVENPSKEFLALRNFACDMEKRYTMFDAESYGNPQSNTPDFENIDQIGKYIQDKEEIREENIFEIWKDVKAEGLISIAIKFAGCDSISSCPSWSKEMDCEVSGEYWPV